jgi:hypothetical protein
MTKRVGQVSYTRREVATFHLPTLSDSSLCISYAFALPLVPYPPPRPDLTLRPTSASAQRRQPAKRPCATVQLPRNRPSPRSPAPRPPLRAASRPRTPRPASRSDCTSAARRSSRHSRPTTRSSTLPSLSPRRTSHTMSTMCRLRPPSPARPTRGPRWAGRSRRTDSPRLLC